MDRNFRGVLIALPLLFASTLAHPQTAAPGRSRPDAGLAPVEINFRNQLPAAYRLVKASFVLDGSKVYEGRVRNGDTFFVGRLPAGDHVLTATLDLQGHGGNSFSYMTSYRIRMRDQLNFSAHPGQPMRVEIVSFARGGPTRSFETRPAIEFAVRYPSPAPPAPPVEAPAPPPLRLPNTYEPYPGQPYNYRW